MAGRIRTIKPELIATERFAALTDAAARLFLGCYSLADDAGNAPAGPSFIGGQIFYARARGATVIGRLLGELETARLIDLYRIDGAPFLAILGWSEKHAPTHQRIEKSRIVRFPRPVSVRSWNEFPDRSGGDTDTDTDSDPDADADRDRRTDCLAASDSDKPQAPLGLTSAGLGPLTARMRADRIAKGVLTERQADDALMDREIYRTKKGLARLDGDALDADQASWLLREDPEKRKRRRGGQASARSRTEPETNGEKFATGFK